MFALLACPRRCFAVFNKRFHKHFSTRVKFFAWLFQVRLHMMLVFLVETSSKISLLRFKLTSWHRKNSVTFCGVI